MIGFSGYDRWKLRSDLDETLEMPEDCCQVCNGRGRIWTDPIYEICPHCHGTGQEPVEEFLEELDEPESIP